MPAALAGAYSTTGRVTTAARSFDGGGATVSVGPGATVAVELTVTVSSGTNPVRGFYVTDYVPDSLTFQAGSVTLAGSGVSGSLLPESGSTIYAGCITRRWVLETPPDWSENNPMNGSTLVVTYQVTVPGSAPTGDIVFPGFTWVAMIPGDTGNEDQFGYEAKDSAKISVVDNVGPKLVSASAGSDTQVSAVFNEALGSASANDVGNYSISDGTNAVGVSSAALQADGVTVVLTLSSALTEQTQYTLTVKTPNGVKDAAGNDLQASDSTATFLYSAGFLAHWELDDGSGTTAADSIGPNDGTLTNMDASTDWVAGKVGGALDFDGSNDYVEIGKTASQLGIGGSHAKTVTAWAYTRAFNGGGIFECGTHSNGQDFSLRTQSANDSWRTQFWGSSFDLDFTYSSLGKWVHFAVVYDGAKAIVYADGAEAASKTVALNTTDTKTFKIGRWRDSYFDGIIDDVRLYDKALSPSQVQDLYSQGAVNHAPVAVADSYSTEESTQLVVAAPGVLENDTDSDLDQLTAVLVADVTNGTLALSSTGSFTYDPAAGWSGDDTFTYKANDGTEDSNTVTVTITVSAVNDPPTAKADSYSTPKGVELVVAAPGVLENDTDPEGDTLSAVLATDVSHGTLALAADGSFTYAPDAGYSGQDSFTYKANDGTSGSGTVTVTIAIITDTDSDGMDDDWEMANFGDLSHDGTADTDSDGLTDLEEFQNGTDPNVADTDSDGLSDGAEVKTHGTDPTRMDTDGDGLSDSDEVNGSPATDPTKADTDGDGLSDYEEVNGSPATDPTLADTDGDGLSDGAEVSTHGTDPTKADTDGDGLSDSDEVNGSPATDPTKVDTDADGLSDGEEVSTHGTDPTRADTDSDGLSDRDEVVTHGTNPRLADSDTDGMPDGWEATYGLDPLDYTDADLDTDSDGYTNLQEFAGGSDPTDAGSRPGGEDDRGWFCSAGPGDTGGAAWALALLLLALAALRLARVPARALPC
jgi:VCBS repeat-containing protein